MKNKIDMRLKELTPEELKVYRAILKAFPATSKESAFDYALQGGVRFNYVPS